MLFNKKMFIWADFIPEKQFNFNRLNFLGSPGAKVYVEKVFIYGKFFISCFKIKGLILPLRSASRIIETAINLWKM